MRILGLRSILLAGALTLAASGAWATACPGPDGFGYTCITNPAGAAFMSPTTSGNLVVCDDCGTTRPIGFTYRHYGVSVTDVWLSSNGFLQFRGSGTDNFAGGCTWPTGGLSGYFGLYDDRYPPGNGFVRDGLTGTAPNRVYFIEFNNVPYCCNSGPPNSTFQMQVFENGGAGEKVRIVWNVCGRNSGDVGIQNIASTQGLSYACRTTTCPTAVEFSKPASGGTGSTGTCDLAPIEAKLDDGTRFTSDTERNTQTTTITNNVINALRPDITRLETKLDDGTRFTSDTERTTQTNTLVTEINANETKIDRLEAKLDDERRFTDDSELQDVQQSIEAGIDALEAKADDTGNSATTQFEIEMEHALGEDTNLNRPMNIFMTPNANGGKLEDIRALVVKAIARTSASGCSTGSANGYLLQGDNAYAGQHWDTAYVGYARAYQETISGPCN